MEDNKAYIEGYKAGFADCKLEMQNLQRKYALALLALVDVNSAYQAFVKTALPKR